MCSYCNGDFDAMPDRPVYEQNRDFERGVRFQQHVIFSSSCLNNSISAFPNAYKISERYD